MNFTPDSGVKVGLDNIVIGPHTNIQSGVIFVRTEELPITAAVMEELPPEEVIALPAAVEPEFEPVEMSEPLTLPPLVIADIPVDSPDYSWRQEFKTALEHLHQNDVEIINQLIQSEHILIRNIEKLKSIIDNVWYKRLWRWMKSVVSN